MTAEKDSVIEDQKTQLMNLNNTINSLRKSHKYELDKSEHRFFYLVEKLEIEISEIYSIKKEADEKFEENES